MRRTRGDGLANPWTLEVNRPTIGREEIQAVYQQMADAGVRFGSEEPLPTIRT